MVSRPASKKEKAAAFVEHAKAALARGDYAYAVAAFEKAHDTLPTDISLLMGLANAQRSMQLYDEAAATLTKALAVAPTHREAASSLSAIVYTSPITSTEHIHPAGLQAAFAHTGIDRMALGRVALAYLADREPLASTLAACVARPRETGCGLVVKNTAKLLTLPLFQLALVHSVNRRLDLECLLTALRRALLLETPTERFASKELLQFIIALIQQCWNNGHAFFVSEEERAALTAIDLPSGEGHAPAITPQRVRAMGMHLLYRPVSEVSKPKSPLLEVCPRPLRQMLEQRLAEDANLTDLAATLPSILPPQSRDAISLDVGRHYEMHPYPRWTSLLPPELSSGKKVLSSFFTPVQLRFMDGSFSVLIAGAGTGYHAVCSAIRYGPKARVLAIDLSRNSLAYGRMMAGRLGVTNLEFLQADIMALDGLTDRFEIIESVGVLHHTRDPFAAWEKLLTKLAPRGLMWIGLYSAVSRANISALRSEPSFPGANASDDEVRTYRHRLMAATEPKGVARLRTSEDFFSLPDFRDLVLNPNEIPLTLPDIDTFLQRSDLNFAGFLAPSVWTLYRSRFPQDAWPGTLSRWWELEQANPTLFDAMYQFWCARAR